MKSKSVRIINMVMIAFFVLSTVVQYNDPDPLMWMVLYAAGAVVCLLFHFGKMPSWLAGLYGLLAVGMAVYLASRVLGQQPIFDEEGREMMGMFIAVIWMGVLFKQKPA